ncbi:N2227-domain-containing protein [Rhodotorula diobovata]|uniref:carnosine N-methyltransferase n=1 Tax=Rhodotorula diobovata TaxID=5288 RepID=A0A5C5FNB0_9BASI|nr:N2227-domain-containing protein [Rhodotorula diobovata]
MPHSHMQHTHSHSHPHPAHPDHAPLDDDDASSSSPRTEAHHQATTSATFDSYKRHALAQNQHRRAQYYALSKQHRDLVPGYNDLLRQVDDKLAVNALLVERMIDVNPFPPPPDAALDAPAPTEADHERLRSTLRQCVRDWSETGKHERDTTYTPILDALEAAYADLSTSERAQTRVLVPGAGLGRLAWEVVRAGFTCQANEFSLHMLIASHFILNHTASPNAYTLHPFLHSFSNIRTSADLLAPCYLPDVRTDEIARPGSEAEFSFAAGDFLDLYADAPGSWDACVTCFFLDTARNIVRYLEVLHSLLKPGGLWINCGPTLWHFEGDKDASSLELPLEDVKALARRIGFDISDEREIETCYTTNPRSMLRHEYSAAFWTARKVDPVP